MGNGLNRTIQVSPALHKFLGVAECSRPESMKRVWDYIKDQKLQVHSLCAVLCLATAFVRFLSYLSQHEGFWCFSLITARFGRSVRCSVSNSVRKRITEFEPSPCEMFYYRVCQRVDGVLNIRHSVVSPVFVLAVFEFEFYLVLIACSSTAFLTRKDWALSIFQNPQNKKEVFCDETLKPVLGGKDKVGFLEIARLLSEHFPKAPKVPKTPKIPKEPKLPKEPKSPKFPKTRKAQASPAAPNIWRLLLFIQVYLHLHQCIGSCLNLRTSCLVSLVIWNSSRQLCPDDVLNCKQSLGICTVHVS